MIEARDLTKRYAPKVAVDHLSFVIEPGRVTGFLGPNGAGKSTTMRMVLGLDAPSSGSVTVNGRPYAWSFTVGPLPAVNASPCTSVSASASPAMRAAMYPKMSSWKGKAAYQ